jgi:hypothetical protein
MIVEKIFLHKQLEIYQRSDPKVKIKKTDRLFFSLIKESLLNWRKRLFALKPETVIKWLWLFKTLSALKTAKFC